MNELTCAIIGAAILATTVLNAAERPDWLLDGTSFPAQIKTNKETHKLSLDNGLVRRVFLLAPNAATVTFENLMTGESLLRAIRPEALVELDGVQYDVGGLSGQPVQNF